MKPTMKPPGSWNVALETKIRCCAFKFCFQFRLAPLQHGVPRGAHPRDAAVRLGRAVPVDPIKPTLKAPGTKRLKLKCHRLLSSFAFNFNLRHQSSCAALRVDDVMTKPTLRSIIILTAGIAGVLLSVIYYW
jgi:hypothetical protein